MRMCVCMHAWMNTYIWMKFAMGRICTHTLAAIRDAFPLNIRVEPALKPYHPNHKMRVPVHNNT